MLKKISVASAILLLVCILVSIALLPFAIDDFGKMVSQYETAHSGYTLFYEKDTEGISSLYLSDYYEDLEIVESPDGVIRAYARESIPYSVSYAEMLEPDGQLTLERRYNGLSGNNFSREYMVDRVLASMSNSSYSFRLEVPKDLPVKVTNYYRLTNPQELDVSLYQPEPEELPQPEESRPERLTNQQAREYYNKAASVDRELETLVNQYKLGQISENEYLEERTLLLDSYADVLSGLFMGTLSLEGEDYASILEKTQYDLQEDYIEATHERLELDFRNGNLTKEQYYEQDLELERQKTEVEGFQEQYLEAEDLLDLLENMYGYDYSID